MNKNIIHISKILESVMGNLRISSDIEMIKIWDFWEEAVGKQIAENAKPSVFKNGILIINVSSSAWLQELKFLKYEILNSLNKLFNKKIVKEIRLKIGKTHS